MPHNARRLRFRAAFAVAFVLAWGAPALVAAARTWTSSPVADKDTDGDGLSDFAEAHKYGTNPNKRSTAGDGVPDGDVERRRGWTYTIRSVMQIARPFDVAAMNDDYQDARVVSQDKNSVTVEITYYPLNTVADAIKPGPRDWRARCARDPPLAPFLAPSPAVNWNAALQKQIVADLARDGIRAGELSDAELVRKVSAWAMARSHGAEAFGVWAVQFPNGKPSVYPPLRAYFDGQKKPGATDADAFGQEALESAMYENRVHGSCTSSSVYMATILRALGVPTRIVVCIPPADGNDPAQVKALGKLRHNAVRDVVQTGASDARGFANHVFNEAYVGGRWGRLNYDRLGQNIVDAHYFGLLTHIATCRNISDLPLAQTWGTRYVRYNDDLSIEPRLSSVNPYRLVSLSDQFGKWATVKNPPADVHELQTATIKAVLKKGDPAVPEWVKLGNGDLLVRIEEWLPGQDYKQLRRFYDRATHDFVLQAPGRPDVRLHIENSMYSAGDGAFQGFVARFPDGEREKVAPGVAYTLQAVDSDSDGKHHDGKHRWDAQKRSVTVTLP